MCEKPPSMPEIEEEEEEVENCKKIKIEEDEG